MEISGSKGYTNRALILGALSKSAVKIKNAAESLETKCLIKALSGLGIKISGEEKEIIVEGSFKDVEDKEYVLDVKNFEGVFRFLTAFCCIVPGTQILKTDKKIAVGELVGALQDLGGEIEFLEEEGFSPVKIKSSKLSSGVTRMHGDINSQYFSALLLMGPVIGGIELEVMGEQISKSCVNMSLDIIKKFGGKVFNEDYKKYKVLGGEYKLDEYVVEGDYLEADELIIEALKGGTGIEVQSLNKNSLQGYAKFLEVVTLMGNKISFEGDKLILLVRGIKNINADLGECPKLIEELSLMVAETEGESQISGLRTLRIQEPEKLIEIQGKLTKIGVKSESDLNTLTIYGKKKSFSL